MEDTVHALVHDADGNLKCMVRVPNGSSRNQVMNALWQLYPNSQGWVIHKALTSKAEAETILEFGCCDLVDMMDTGDTLMPMQGWRDEHGNRVD